jgi:hypothetical protein
MNTDCPVPIPADSTDPWPRPDPGDSTITPMPPFPGPGACVFDHRGTYGEDGMLAAGEISAAVEWIFAGTGGNSFAFHARLLTEPAPQDGVISGVVFEDHNENGQRDLDEPGIQGVGIGLVMPDLVRIQVTDEHGRYVFEVQEPGLYTLNLTVPLPVPPVPLVIVIQEALGVAVQLQLGVIVTVTGVAVPPAAGAAWLFGSIVETHAPACVTVKVWPAMVMVPVR